MDKLKIIKKKKPTVTCSRNSKYAYITQFGTVGGVSLGDAISKLNKVSFTHDNVEIVSISEDGRIIAYSCVVRYLKKGLTPSDIDYSKELLAS